MRLHKNEIAQEKNRLEALLQLFSKEESPQARFFASALPYVMSADFATCPEANGQLIGIGYVFRNILGIPNLGMAVLSNWQGKGYGDIIMYDVLAYTYQHRSCLCSCLWKTNIPIIRLHQKWGWRKVGTGKNNVWYVKCYSVRSWLKCWIVGKLLSLYDYMRA